MSKLFSLPLSALVLAGALAAQKPQTPPHARQGADVDSGFLHNAAAHEQVVFSQVLRYPTTEWLQFRFGEQTSVPAGSYLRLTGKRDGAVQRHHARSLGDYRMWSAAFNGGEVLLELVAGPRTRGNRVVVDEVIRGLAAEPQPESICGPSDDRTQSFDARQGRVWIGCTGWLIGPAGGQDLMLTAGHCVTGGPFMLELNVPNSQPNGTVVRSHPNDQYPFTVFQSLNAGIGSDWSVNQVGTNSNTGLLPTQANGGTFYSLGTIPGGTGGQNITITGYGVSSTGTLSQVQKTHTGPLAQINPTSLCYTTDTTGGNSGSPVIHQNTGTVIGIHTHGGCSSGGGCNSGTRIDRSDLQNAISTAGRTPGKFELFGAGCQGTGAGGGVCVSLNGSGGSLPSSTAPNEYAYEVSNGQPRQVAAFEIFSQSTTGASVTVPAAIYADAGGSPATNPIATTSVTIGGSPGFYRATFGTPVTVNGNFYVAIDHSSSTTNLSSLSSGSSGRGFWRRPPFGGGTWAVSGLITAPAYRILCAGGPSGAVPAIGNLGVPMINQSYTVSLGQAATQTNAFLFSGLSNSSWAGGSLPFSLSALGGGSCSLLVSTEASITVPTAANGQASVMMPVPNSSSLVGAALYHQWFVLDSGANTLGVAVTAGAKATIGG